MRSKRIQLKLSHWLLQAIDEAAAQNLTNRSSFIREAVVMRLNDQYLTPKPRLEDTLELFRQADKYNGG